MYVQIKRPHQLTMLTAFKRNGTTGSAMKHPRFDASPQERQLCASVHRSCGNSLNDAKQVQLRGIPANPNNHDRYRVCTTLNI